VPVHDIQVQDLCSGRLDSRDIVRQPREVRRQQRRRDPNPRLGERPVVKLFRDSTSPAENRIEALPFGSRLNGEANRYAPMFSISSSHCLSIFFYASSSTSTALKDLPSMNSRLAPPPVLTWLTLSLRPALSIADALSPPPMMVIAPLAVTSAKV